MLPFRTDRKWFNKTRRQKKYVRIRFRGKTLIRLSTIKFTKHYNLTSTLDLVRGVRNQVLAVYVSHWVVCCFGSLQRSKRGEWLLDKSINSFLRYVTFENQCLYNAMKFLRRFCQVYSVNAEIMHFFEGNCRKSLPRQGATHDLLFQTNFYSEKNIPQTWRASKNLLHY